MMGLFWDAVASFIGHYEVAKESGSKFVPQNSPTVQLALTQSTINHRRQCFTQHPDTEMREEKKKNSRTLLCFY